MKFHRSLLQQMVMLCFILPLSCTTDADPAHKPAARGKKNFPETFEQGNKHAYAAASTAFATGDWLLDEALVGSTEADSKNGHAALRLARGGRATMLFDVPGTVSASSFRYACYGRDRQSVLSLWYSNDGGIHWQQAGRQIKVSAGTLATATFPLNTSGLVRFSLHNDGNGRVNIDDFDVQPAPGDTPAQDKRSDIPSRPTRDDNMALGNPSDAATGSTDRNNYLLVHPQYTLSYNDAKGMANWVSWHLSPAWRGSATRCNCFFSDNALPAGFFRATTSAYIATGFDRGHLCPSEDRTASPEDNAATFLMTNITPQAPLMNQQPWEGLESYARTLAAQDQELYIIAGSYGQGGEGSRGSAGTIAGGSITVPAHFWKIMVVLPIGSDDLHRISKDTRIIAVDMPNVQSVSAHDWTYYRTSVQHIEEATGYHFLSAVPAAVSKILKSKIDDLPVE